MAAVGRVGGFRPKAPLWRTRVGVCGNALVLGWLVCCAAAIVAGGVLPVPGWLVVHLFGLGAASTAVLLWSEHFVVTLCRVPGSAPWSLAGRAAGVSAAVLAVLAGVCSALAYLALAGVAGIVGLGGWHAAVLARAARHARGARFGYLAWYYTAAALAWIAAAAAAGTLYSGAAGDDWRARLLDVHVHLAVLGWLGLAVLGTALTLWPTVLRTQIADGTEQAGRWAWWPLAGGLVVLCGGILAGQAGVALAGLCGYAIGVGITLVPFVRTMRRRPPRSGAAWLMAVGTGWLLVGLAMNGAALLVPAGARAALEQELPTVLLLGFLAPILAGALSYLLVPALARGPAQRRAVTALLERAWQARVVAAGLAVPLVTVPAAAPVHVAGWLLAVGSYGGFAALGLRALAITRPGPMAVR
jgi:nitrite reductase (NO-forming)